MTTVQRFYTKIGVVVFFVYVIDRISKYWAMHFLQTPIVLWRHVLELTFVGNDHFLFYWQAPTVVIYLSIIIMFVVVVYLVVREYLAGHHQFVALLLFVLIGAFSNMIDRFYYGYVVDFINVPFWSVFNVADMSIVGGVLVFFIFMWKNSE